MHRAIAALVFLAPLLAACPEDPGSSTCSPACGEYEECVDGVCRDRTCRPPCREGRVCVRGYCLRTCDASSSAGCVMSETCCPDLRACVDLRTDLFNCGECGFECDRVRSNICSDRRCGCEGYSANPCGEGFGCCADGCKDLQNDPESCGECGHSCGGLDCVAGQCRCSTDEPCPADQECCPDGCRSLQVDPRNCGACGNSCATGEDCCSGGCVNTLADPTHCGLCGETCGEGERCCLGVCVDVGSDPFNCGDCLVDCGAGGVCEGGSCR